MVGVSKGLGKSRGEPQSPDVPINSATEELSAVLSEMTGAYAEPVPMPRGAPPPAVMYKLMGKMFAILSIRGEAFIILKCDPALADILRQTYAGVGHRSHLDRRFWISIDLNADVPMDEIRKLIAGSYDLVYAGLTRKQKAELETRLQD